MKVRYVQSCQLLLEKDYAEDHTKGAPMIPPVGAEVVLNDEDWDVHRVIFNPEDDLITIDLISA